MDTAAAWKAEHAQFERILAFLEIQLGLIRSAQQPNYDLMCEATNYLCYFGARYHHAREAIAFGFIRETDPGRTSTVLCLASEHDTIAVTGEHLDALMINAAAGGALAQTRIEDDLPALVRDYRNHIRIEQREIIPYAVAHLNPEQWEAVAHAAPPGPDPFLTSGMSGHNPTFGSEARMRYRALYERMQIHRVPFGRARARRG